MRISDWSSDVCSSDLLAEDAVKRHARIAEPGHAENADDGEQSGAQLRGHDMPALIFTIAIPNIRITNAPSSTAITIERLRWRLRIRSSTSRLGSFLPPTDRRPAPRTRGREDRKSDV